MATIQQQQRETRGFWTNVWQGFATSVWLTHIWEWFVSLLTRAVQPVLFGTVMYNLAGTYPGFRSPGDTIDLFVFLAQQAALDIAGLGLPTLAKQAEANGNSEGAKEARALATWLFRVMVAGVIWAGVEHTVPTIPPIVKTVIGVIFVIVRAFFAIKYSHVMGELKHSDGELAPLAVTPQPVTPVTPSLTAEQINQLVTQSLSQFRVGLMTEVTQQVTQAVSQQPLPTIDYDTLVGQLAPMVDTAIAAQIAALASQHAAPQAQLDAAPARRPAQLPRATVTPVTDEQKLEEAYQTALSQGGKVSGRGLSEMTGINRNKTASWLKNRQSVTDEAEQTDSDNFMTA